MKNKLYNTCQKIIKVVAKIEQQANKATTYWFAVQKYTKTNNEIIDNAINVHKSVTDEEIKTITKNKQLITEYTIEICKIGRQLKRYERVLSKHSIKIKIMFFICNILIRLGVVHEN